MSSPIYLGPKNVDTNHQRKQTNTRGGSRGGAPGARPPLKLEKIWFFCVKSWFFTRNTPKIFAPPSVRRNFFKGAPPPNLKSWIRPWIPPCRRSRNTHNRSFQIESCRIDIRRMSLFPRTVRDWNLLPPDIVELDTPEALKARIVSLYWV